MKHIRLAIAAALAVAAPLGFAQTSPEVQGQAQAPTSTEAPAPIVIETNVDLTSEPGPPADLRAAREEAVNALHWAKTEGCRSDASPRDCVARAQAEYNRVIADLGGRRR